VTRRGHRWPAAVLAGALVVAACSDGGGGADPDQDQFAEETTLPSLPSSAGTPTAPLLGLEVADQDVATRPAMAVKVGNTEAARPQAGVAQADVVFEELVEAGLTRLVAIFQSSLPAEVGPVRSARANDISVVFPFGQPLFVSSGGNSETVAAVEMTGLTNISAETVPDAFARRDDRQAPDDLYALSEGVYAHGSEVASVPPQVLRHRLPGIAARGGRAVQGVTVDYGDTDIAFRWDPEGGVWHREQNGSRHVDVNGVDLAPENVIVQFVDYEPSGQVDSNGAPVQRAVLDGVEGEAWVFTGGQLIEGLWFKGNFTNPSIYTTEDNQVIELTPGRTWILLPEIGMADVIE
jgi:Protein of unknown function (DUF3048) N-terminal domain/Protein of unknown function (DUF3048) C-terminal domain